MTSILNFIITTHKKAHYTMSILSSFNLTASDLGALITEPEILQNSSNTTRLTVGQEVAYNCSMNGVNVNGFITLKSARLTRLSLLEQSKLNASDPSESTYWLATGIMNPVDMNVEIIVNGQRINMIDLFHKVTEETAGTEISREDFIANASKIGLKFTTGMPMFFQQFGANFDNFKGIVDVFKAHGAEDVIEDIKNNTGSIKAAYSLKTGLPVTSFEVGRVDRTQSARYKHDGVGQGFLDFLDAQFSQLLRIVSLRKAARLKLAQTLGTCMSENEIIKLKNAAKDDANMAKQWPSNWGGAQKRLVRLKSGGFEAQNVYDPVSVPCGRFTVVQSTGEPYEVDLWTNKKAGIVDVSTQPVSTVEEPF